MPTDGFRGKRRISILPTDIRDARRSKSSPVTDASAWSYVAVGVALLSLSLPRDTYGGWDRDIV